MADSKYSTTAGIPTRGDAYAKLSWHLDEAQDQAAVLSHLHSTEGSVKDQAMARGWLIISEQLKRFKAVVIEIAKGNLQ